MVRKEEHEGVEWIILDSLGSLVCVGANLIKTRTSIKTLESLAILEGLRHWTRVGNQDTNLLIESDAIEVIKLMTGLESDLTEINNVIEQIDESSLLRKDSFSFVCCLRACNAAAHYIARAPVVFSGFCENFFWTIFILLLRKMTWRFGGNVSLLGSPLF